jgi:plasmid maintenance system antidote protein VapI
MGYREDAHYESLAYETYDPNHLLDSVLDQLELADDEALARVMEVEPSVMAEIRRMTRSIEAPMLIRMHEMTGLSVARLRNILGDRRRNVRLDQEAEGM